MQNHFEKAVRQLDKAGTKAFVTSISNGKEKRYEVVAKFDCIEAMQEFHRAIVECGRVVREADEPDEKDFCSPGTSAFEHDAGGGKRVIKATTSLGG